MKTKFGTFANPIIFCALILCIGQGCKKSGDSTGGGNNGGNPPVVPDSTYNPTDPSSAATIGFFGNGWKAKSFTTPDNTPGSATTLAATDSLTINVNKVLVKVVPYVYGANSNLWSGQITTQPALMQYLTDLSPNIIRGPGGSISDVYFWNGSDANPAPADAPTNLLNDGGVANAAGYWYGGNAASWTFSLDNYYNLLSQTNSTGIITVNYGYARYGTSANPVATAAHLAADWVRFDKGRTKFWEIGNENFGSWEGGYRIDQSLNKDGQPATITGDLYGTHFNVFADSMKAAAMEIGATIYIGAVIYQEPAYQGAYTSIQTWNQGVLQKAGNAADYFIVHDYFTGYATNSSAADILSTGAAVPASVMNYVKQQTSAAGVGLKPIAFTEWNIQAIGSKQNVSYISGIHAAKTIGSIIKNNFGEASRWDIANGYDNGDDQGMFNNGSEPGAPLWNPRPSFFYLYYFQKFFGDRMVYDTLKGSNTDITIYSSTFSTGQAGTILINSSSLNHVVAIDFQHFPAGAKYYWYILTGGTDNGSFSGQVYVNGTGPSTATGGPLNYASLKAYSAPLTGTINMKLPPFSVVYLVADKK
ncbi:MAG: alpha-L-arabinofuranosidase [Ginsengibacter sp.]